MKHPLFLAFLSFFTFPISVFSQALIKNYEYISFFNPAAAGMVDKLAVTTVHNYYDFSGNVMNSSLGGLEFEMPKINSGFVLNFDLIRDDRRNYAYVQQSEIRNLNLNLGYRYRFETKKDFGISLGVGLRHIRRKVYRRWTGFSFSGYTEEWEGQTWSMNAGLFVDWKNWGLGFSINDLLEPNLKNSMGMVMQSELITRAYNVQLYHNLEFSEKFSLRPQFYFGQVSILTLINDRIHFRQYYFTTELLYGKKFYFAPGIRSMRSSMQNDFNTLSASLQLGGIIINRLQIGAGIEYYIGGTGFNEITVEGVLKYRLRK